jgi:hypothetical protein
LGIDDDFAFFSSLGTIVLAGSVEAVDVHKVLAGFTAFIALDDLPFFEVLPTEVDDDGAGAGAMSSVTTFFAWTDLAGVVAEMIVLNGVLLAIGVFFLALEVLYDAAVGPIVMDATGVQTSAATCFVLRDSVARVVIVHAVCAEDPAVASCPLGVCGRVEAEIF